MMPSATTERNRRDEGRVCALERGNEGSGRAGMRSIRPWSGLNGGTERCSLDTAPDFISDAIQPCSAMWLLKIVLHSKFILFYGNLLESDYIVLHIEHKHGFLVVQLIKIRDKSQQKRLRLSLFLSRVSQQ